jgi:hypothetical protein
MGKRIKCSPPPADGVTLKVGATYKMYKRGFYGLYDPEEYILAQTSEKGYKFVSLRTGKGMPLKTNMYKSGGPYYRHRIYTLLPKGVPEAEAIQINVPVWVSERLHSVVEQK